MVNPLRCPTGSGGVFGCFHNGVQGKISCDLAERHGTIEVGKRI